MSRPRPSTFPRTNPRASQDPPQDTNAVTLSDKNEWYYPSYSYLSEEDAEVGASSGNWGNKLKKNARWVRKGKIAAWGPDLDEWDAQERTRMRLKVLLGQDEDEDNSPPTPTLPHLVMRDTGPALMAPYPRPQSQHYRYSSFVMDKSATQTFRSSLLDELEYSTNSLIEGEATIRRALGRLWQVMSEDHEPPRDPDGIVPKREEDDMPDIITPAIHKLFLPNGNRLASPSHFSSPETQRTNLEKAMMTLRDMQDDEREYVEQLQEIREGIGGVKAQRNVLWNEVRERAVRELQDMALNRD